MLWVCSSTQVKVCVQGTRLCCQDTSATKTSTFKTAENLNYLLVRVPPHVHQGGPRHLPGYLSGEGSTAELIRLWGDGCGEHGVLWEVIRTAKQVMNYPFLVISAPMFRSASKRKHSLPRENTDIELKLQGYQGVWSPRWKRWKRLVTAKVEMATWRDRKWAIVRVACNFITCLEWVFIGAAISTHIYYIHPYSANN